MITIVSIFYCIEYNILKCKFKYEFNKSKSIASVVIIIKHTYRLDMQANGLLFTLFAYNHGLVIQFISNISLVHDVDKPHKKQTSISTPEWRVG